MVVFGQSASIGAKVVVLGQSGCIRQKWLYADKVVVFGIRLLYSSKSDCIRQSCCIRAKVVVIGQSGCFGAKWLYSRYGGCIRAK